MLVSCLAVFIMAFSYEGLKVARKILLKKYVVSEPGQSCQSDVTQPKHDDNNTELLATPTTGNKPCGGSERARVQTSVRYVILLKLIWGYCATR
jgi:hypothetical protein